MANPSIPEFALETSGEQTVLRVSGDWTVRTVPCRTQNNRWGPMKPGRTQDTSR